MNYSRINSGMAVVYTQRFYPQAIAQFDHLYEHVRNRGMSMQEYKTLIADLCLTVNTE